MASDVHIYTAPVQPLTDFIDDCLSEPRRVTCAPHMLSWCHRCFRHRRAMNLSIRCYYDAVYIRCTNEMECREFIKARNRQRYRAAKARARAKEATP